MNYKKKLGVLVCLIGLMTALPAHAQSAFKADGLVESTAGGFKFPDGSVQKTSAVLGGPYVIGGTGPAGGFVFHVTDDGLHGLEAALTDQSAGIVWGCNGTNLVGARAWGLGEGARNTDDIVRGCEEDEIAAALAERYVSPGGYFDWYLPSRWELAQMYLLLHLDGIGDFTSGDYWSSSETGAYDAWYLNFSNGYLWGDYKDQPRSVRAVRAF